MKRSLLLRLLAALIFASPALAEFRAGAARVVINPPAGVNMAGYYNFRACEGVLDDIHASALVIDDSTTRAALITLDLIGAPPQTICDAPGLSYGGTWNSDGIILFGSETGLLQVAATGGEGEGV